MPAKGEFHTAQSPGAHLYKDGNGYATEMKATGDKMTDEAKFRRRLFCAHYVKSLNASSSAEFAGFSSPAAKGNKLLKEPYVQDQLNKLLNELDHDAIMSTNEILFKLKEEAFNSAAANQGARISALAHIAKIRGMMIEKSEVKTVTQCVMVVPALQSPDDWSATAAVSQARLKETVRD